MSILLIGEKPFVDHLQKFLSSKNQISEGVSCINKAKELLAAGNYKIAVCPLPYASFTEGEKLIEFFEDSTLLTKLIFLAENISVSQAIKLVRNGLYSCLNKPFLIEELVQQIESGLVDNTPTEIQFKKHPVILPRYVKGVSESALKMYSDISLVAPTNFNVIIYGETGTGKESVAQRLLSERGDNAPYVAVDCSCLNKELGASELFGHEKGSFTGAFDKKKGAFEQAHKGTLFLDEIGNLGHEVQTYLLRAIQERKIRKVGGTVEMDVDVRILVASNENLWEKVKKGEFREDLYHRLNEFEIKIPPLRERKEDLDLFINHFIKEINRDLNKNIKGFDKNAYQLLAAYSFPGNIRELKNVIRKSALLAKDQDFITTQNLPLEIVNHHILEHHAQSSEKLIDKTSRYSLKDLVKKIELENIMEVLKEVDYNYTKAAQLLNINRKTLYNKLNYNGSM